MKLIRVHVFQKLVLYGHYNDGDGGAISWKNDQRKRRLRKKNEKWDKEKIASANNSEKN